jgi:hypothetical protein
MRQLFAQINLYILENIMSLKKEFTGKTVMPVVSSGGFAVTPIIRGADTAPEPSVPEVA